MYTYLVTVIFYVEVQMRPEVNLVAVRQQTSLFQMSYETSHWNVICWDKYRENYRHWKSDNGGQEHLPMWKERTYIPITNSK